uniref:Uncharacterized protein n=1 Tax=Terrapene triunguis TaxID=2587831 RepID=A0A674JV25_9SAUR
VPPGALAALGLRGALESPHLRALIMALPTESQLPSPSIQPAAAHQHQPRACAWHQLPSHSAWCPVSSGPGATGRACFTFFSSSQIEFICC